MNRGDVVTGLPFTEFGLHPPQINQKRRAMDGGQLVDAEGIVDFASGQCWAILVENLLCHCLSRMRYRQLVDTCRVDG